MIEKSDFDLSGVIPDGEVAKIACENLLSDFIGEETMDISIRDASSWQAELRATNKKGFSFLTTIARNITKKNLKYESDEMFNLGKMYPEVHEALRKNS